MLWRAIALGQLLALLIAATAAASAQLNLLGLSFPTLQSSLNYLLLACTFNVVRLRQQAAQGGDPSDGRWNDRPSLAQRFALTRKWWHYALLALLDVEANFLVVSAYRWAAGLFWHWLAAGACRGEWAGVNVGHARFACFTHSPVAPLAGTPA